MAKAFESRSFVRGSRRSTSAVDKARLLYSKYTFFSKSMSSQLIVGKFKQLGYGSRMKYTRNSVRMLAHNASVKLASDATGECSPTAFLFSH